MSPFSMETMTGIVFMLSRVRRMEGMNRLFQVETKEKMAWVAMAGFMIGMAIWLKV